jgi:division protein 1
MGAVSEVHKYEYPVTALQFDSRKVVACTGENGIEVGQIRRHR